MITNICCRWGDEIMNPWRNYRRFDGMAYFPAPGIAVSSKQIKYVISFPFFNNHDFSLIRIISLVSSLHFWSCPLPMMSPSPSLRLFILNLTSLSLIKPLWYHPLPKIPHPPPPLLLTSKYPFISESRDSDQTPQLSST